MNPIALELYEQFKLLEANFSLLLDKCRTENQKERLRACYVQGWRNYNLAVNRVFDLNDGRIQQLQADLAAQGKDLTTALASVQHITDAISTVGKVVAFGATIALA